jgi:hypothetical protein
VAPDELRCWAQPVEQCEMNQRLSSIRVSSRADLDAAQGRRSVSPTHLSASATMLSNSTSHDGTVLPVSNDGQKCVAQALVLLALISPELRSRFAQASCIPSFGESPIFRCSSFTVSENADVAASYSLASRVFSSQLTCHPALLFQVG